MLAVVIFKQILLGYIFENHPDSGFFFQICIYATYIKDYVKRKTYADINRR